MCPEKHFSDPLVCHQESGAHSFSEVQIKPLILATFPMFFGINTAPITLFGISHKKNDFAEPENSALYVVKSDNGSCGVLGPIFARILVDK